MIVDEFRPIVPGGNPETFRRMRDAAWMVQPEIDKNVEVVGMKHPVCIVEGCTKGRVTGKYCSRHHKNPLAPVTVVTKVTAGIEPGVGNGNADAGATGPTADVLSSVDLLLKRPPQVGMFIDLSGHAALQERLAYHSIDAEQVVYFLGLLVAGELEHHPYKGNHS